MAQQTTATRTFQPGTVLDITFADHESDDTARVMVDREWDDNDDYDGLKVKLIQSEPQSTLPRYCGSLYPDENLLRDNHVEDKREREDNDDIPETYDIETMRVLSTEDRLCTRGTFNSPRSAHVKRAVVDAINSLNSFDIDDPMFAASEQVGPENFTLFGAGEHSERDGVVLTCTAALELQQRETIRAELRDALKDHYGFWCIRKGVWAFYYDDGGRERDVK